MHTLTLSQSCPRCRRSNCVVIDGNKITCTAESCQFSVVYRCPICNSTVAGDDEHIEDADPGFKCHHCKNKITYRKIKYLLDNAMVVDHDVRCDICHGPTVCRRSMNLGHRCFFFPKCSGQASLFGEAAESLVFIDFETTGLDPTRDSIIEIGALKIDSEGYEHTYQTFIKPKQAVSEKITGITGITNEMVENGLPVTQGIDELIAFIGPAKIVVHNAEFDMIWLVSALVQLERQVPETSVICTLKWARENGEARAGLGALAKKYNIAHANAHRALADAATTKELYFILKSQKKADRPVQTLNDFLQLSEKVAASWNSNS